MAIDISSGSTYTCYRCGKKFNKLRTNFAASYSALNKGVGYTSICRSCIDIIYQGYLATVGNAKDAARQTCRKLDLYWDENLFNSVANKSGVNNFMLQYISRLTGTNYAGKSYDDTMIGDGTLWSFKNIGFKPEEYEIKSKDDDEEVPAEIVSYWGAGQTKEMYRQLEQRKSYYQQKDPTVFQDGDIGSDILMRQICLLDVTIAKDAAAGKPVDKSINSLNTLLGSLNMKPAQKKDDDLDQILNNTPMGVWIRRWEDKRPLPKVEESEKDARHIKKYIFTWMGHLCKLVGFKNGYTKLYDEEIQRLRVERPEYEDEDDETLLIAAYSEDDE